MTGDIQQHIRRRLVIDTVEKAYPTHRNIIPLGLVFFVDKSSDPADYLAILVLQEPARKFAMPEGLVSLRIEYFFDFIVHRAYIARI